jgi:hypothetical protein
MKIEGFKDGDRVWAAVVYIKDGVGDEPAKAVVFVAPATILLAAGGIVQEDGRDPRIGGYGETYHLTRQAAHEWAAAEIRRSADNLYRQAADLAEPRVVTV